eukprot:scaffold12586_cov132-Isochrysis_galbana.AAC.4
MDDGRGSGKAIHIYVPKPFGAHAKAAHMEVMVDGPGAPTKVSITILEDHERARVEVGHVVVDPLLKKRSVIANFTRQPLQRIHMASHTYLRVARGRGRPSLCTSVTVIGLNLAAPNQRMKMEKTADATRIR